MTKWSLWTLACLAACIPSDHVLIGRACDALSPCPDSLCCQANACVAACDAGVRNLLSNPGFEAGTTDWSGDNQNSDVESASNPIRSGVASAQLSLTPGANEGIWGLATANRTIPLGTPSTPLRVTYCGQAWVARGSNQNPLYAQIAVKSFDAGLFSAKDAGLTALPDPAAGWALVTTAFFVDGGQDVALWVVTERSAGDGPFFVDDAALWASPDGGCADGP